MDLLEVRKKMKSKKPNFVRQCFNKKPRLSKTGYRKAKGIDSKMRLNLRGHLKKISVGYKSPIEIRGLSREGLVMVNISSIKALEGIDKKKQGVIISSSVGMKKRVEMIKKAKELGIIVLNFKNAEEHLKKIEEKIIEMRKSKEQKKQEHEKKLKESEKAAEKKGKEERKELENVLSDEEKKEAEKREQDKLLTKKE